jgi:conjugative relaxase-like TrwC/TraI family protein
MFEGRDPDRGELLGRPHGRNAVPAFDVVLRPTKSVSILYGLGDKDTGRAVLAAHHAGLAEAVGYLDGHLGARRGHGGVQHVSGQGLLAVGFDHRTSREGDPLLHTHLVIANRIQGPDGRWTALDGRDLYRHRLAADAIYRATYQRTLSRSLGVEWIPADAHGNRELQGMPEDLVRSFSKRTDQIDAELERLEADGRERTPRLVKWTVQATHKPKRHETPDTLYDRWRQEAAERGHDADTLVRAVTGRTASEATGADRWETAAAAPRRRCRWPGWSASLGSRPATPPPAGLLDRSAAHRWRARSRMPRRLGQARRRQSSSRSGWPVGEPR